MAQAESVADLISAQTEEAVLAAQNSLSGKFSSDINACIDSLGASRVFVEASLDFPEEETGDEDLNRCDRRNSFEVLLGKDGLMRRKALGVGQLNKHLLACGVKAVRNFVET